MFRPAMEAARMQDNKVTITVTMVVKSGLEDRVRGILKVLAEAGQEDGCLEYRIYESLIYPLVFMIYGRWRDEAAYMRYMASPRTKAYDELQAKEMLDRPYDLKRWMPLR
jgi:quinol monooxygenase YgiN